MSWSTVMSEFWRNEDYAEWKCCFCLGRRCQNGALLELHYAIKFCFHLGKTASKMLALIKETYKGNALLRTQFFWWCSEFKNELETVENMEWSGHTDYLFWQAWGDPQKIVMSSVDRQNHFLQSPYAAE